MSAYRVSAALIGALVAAAAAGCAADDGPIEAAPAAVDAPAASPSATPSATASSTAPEQVTDPPAPVFDRAIKVYSDCESPASLPVKLEYQCDVGMQHPVIIKMRWTKWDASGASGTGVLGGPAFVAPQKVAVRLSNVVRAHTGGRVFQTITVTNAQGQRSAERLNTQSQSALDRAQERREAAKRAEREKAALAAEKERAKRRPELTCTTSEKDADRMLARKQITLEEYQTWFEVCNGA